MRHHNRNYKLGRVKRQRVALLRSLARALILHEGITTTEAKAKALRPFVERLVTISKSGALSGIRTAAKRLDSPKAGKKLKELARRYEKHTGGYTRIVRLGRIGKRVCDMSRIEFVK